VVRAIAQERYDEGYERGVHDHDAARLLERLLAMREGAGLLAYPAAARALALVFWAATDALDAGTRARWQRTAQSLARLADVLGDRGRGSSSRASSPARSPGSWSARRRSG